MLGSVGEVITQAVGLRQKEERWRWERREESDRKVKMEGYEVRKKDGGNKG